MRVDPDYFQKSGRTLEKRVVAFCQAHNAVLWFSVMTMRTVLVRAGHKGYFSAGIATNDPHQMEPLMFESTEAAEQFCYAFNQSHLAKDRTEVDHIVGASMAGSKWQITYDDSSDSINIWLDGDLIANPNWNDAKYQRPVQLEEKVDFLRR
jgi:hypothetical protein